MDYRTLTNDEIERWVYSKPEDAAATAEMQRRATRVLARSDDDLAEAEARIEQLESDVDHADSEVSRLENELDEANDRIAELTSSEGLV